MRSRGEPRRQRDEAAERRTDGRSRDRAQARPGKAASPAARRPFEQLPVAHLSEEERDERLEAVIEAVELDYLLGRYGMAFAAHHSTFLA